MKLNLNATNLRELFDVPKYRTDFLDTYWRDISKKMVDKLTETDVLDQNMYIHELTQPCINENERLLAVYHAGAIINKVKRFYNMDDNSQTEDDCNCPACTLRRILKGKLKRTAETHEQQNQNTAAEKSPTGAIKTNKNAREIYEAFCLTKEQETKLDKQIKAALISLTPTLKKSSYSEITNASVDAFAKIGENEQERAYVMWVCGFKCFQAKLINEQPLAAILMGNIL